MGNDGFHLLCKMAQIYSRVWFDHTDIFPRVQKYRGTDKLIWARLGVSGTINIKEDSSNLCFPYFNFFKHPVSYSYDYKISQLTS